MVIVSTNSTIIPGCFTSYKEAGIEDNTIVIWSSDNGPSVTATHLSELQGGHTGPFRGEIGDAYEGSIRTAGMIKWLGHIKPQASSAMFAIHDFMPTLASIIGAKLPNTLPIDGGDQSPFLLGKQSNSNRNHLLSFISDRLVAVRWKQFRFYPVEITSASNQPSRAGLMGTMSETTSFPQIYNIEAAPKERVDIAIEGFAWTLGPYLKLISNYKASLKEHPNRPGANFTKF